MSKIKKTVALLTLMLAMTTASNGQIFVMEDDATTRFGTEVYNPDGVIPLNGSLDDQTNEIYTPLGSGLLLLCTLGGAYLMNQKRNKNN